MTEVLTGPFAIAALVAGIAGLAKLRSPAAAAGALYALGLPGDRGPVRAVAVLELAVAAACLGWPGRWTAVALACAYGVFTATAVMLRRRRAPCGCFGQDGDPPVSAVHAVLSAVLAAACAAAALWPPPSVLTGGSVALAIGVLGAAYAVVLAYTELPAAWSASWR